PQPARTAASPTTVSAILVDVVVRDRKGDPVPDLTQADFEIYEDGERQNLGSFTPIFLDAPKAEDVSSSAPLPSAAPVAAASQPAPSAAPTTTAAVLGKAPEMIALVFDR